MQRRLQSWYKNGGSATSPIDVSFSRCPQLQPLACLVFALLQIKCSSGLENLLAMPLQCYGAKFSSSCHISISEVILNPGPIRIPMTFVEPFAIDNHRQPNIFPGCIYHFDSVLLFYSRFVSSLPCGTKLSVEKHDKEAEARMDHHYQTSVYQGSSGHCHSFENYLIEEQDVDRSGFTSVTGFVSFLKDITQSVAGYMK